MVGPTEEAFFIHTNLAVAKSTFFKSAMNGNWIEASTKKVELPEDDRKAFKVFVHWLYYDTVEYKLGAEEDWLKILAEAWILGDKLGSRTFTNLVMNSIRAHTGWLKENEPISPGFPGPNDERQATTIETIIAIVERTLPNSPLRQFLLKYCAAFVDPEVMCSCIRTGNSALADFMTLAVSESIYAWESRYSLFIVDFCDLHVPPPKGENCCEIKGDLDRASSILHSRRENVISSRERKPGVFKPLTLLR